MKNFKTVKANLLNGRKVSHNSWSILVNSDDQVVMTDPSGDSRTSSFIYFDNTVHDFCKAAGIPEKVPAPKKYKPVQKGVIGPDSSTDKAFKDPKIQNQPVMQGKTPEKGLGSDTSMKEPFSNPAVNKRPQPSIEEGGLMDKSLGPDSSSREPKFARKRSRMDSSPQELADSFMLEYKMNPNMSVEELKDIVEYSNLDWSDLEILADVMLQSDDYQTASDLIDLMSEAFPAGSEPGIDHSPVMAQMGYSSDSDSFPKEVDLFMVADNVTSQIESMPIEASAVYAGYLVDGSANLRGSVSDGDFVDIDVEYDAEMDGEARDEFESSLSIAFKESGRTFTFSEIEERGTLIDSATINDEEEYQEFFNSTLENAQANGSTYDAVMAGKVASRRAQMEEPEESEDSDDQGEYEFVEELQEHIEEMADIVEDFEEMEDGGHYVNEEGGESEDSLSFEKDFGKSSTIVDSFLAPREIKSYEQLLNEAPDERLLADIMDPDKWVANRVSDMIDSDDSDKNCDNDCSAETEEDEDPNKKESVRLKENWGEAGAYGRDIEAESAEELYHMVRSFGSEDDYDWTSMTPREPGQVTEEEIAVVQARAAQNVKDSTEIGKQAVDQATQDYWSDYFGEYGEDLTDDVGVDVKIKQTDNSSESEEEDDDKDEDRGNKGEGDSSDVYDPKVQQSPKPQGQQSVGKNPIKAQAAPPAAPPAGPAAPGAPAKAPAAPGAAPGAPPAAPAKPAQPAPGAGDEGLKTLGWTDQDIMGMQPDQKQKIMQVQLQKPGTVPGQDAQPAPVKPAGPGAPAPSVKPPAQAPGAPAAPAAPVTPPQPAPTAARVMREASDANKVRKAFRKLVKTAQEDAMQPQAPAAPAAPVTPTVPAAPEQAPAGGAKSVMDSGTPEQQVANIYSEVLTTEVPVVNSKEIPVEKATMFTQRVLTEVGMSVDELKQLFGTENLMNLFK